MHVPIIDFQFMFGLSERSDLEPFWLFVCVFSGLV